MAIVSFKNTILKNLFSKPYTRKTEKEFPEGTRGHVENDMDLCILCGLCSIKCPTHAITVDKVEKTWNIRPMSCIQCRCCVDSCPKKSLSMGTRFQEPGSEKIDEILDPSKLQKKELPLQPRQRLKRMLRIKQHRKKKTNNDSFDQSKRGGTRSRISPLYC